MPRRRPCAKGDLPSTLYKGTPYKRYKEQERRIRRYAPKILTKGTNPMPELLPIAHIHLIDPEGFQRCSRCRYSKPIESGYYKKDIKQKICKDCRAKEKKK